ncbi:hypothetical protein J6590_091286 [Homalodisca vitripennis]|nr:hypothetical protein J6590_091286 [Homalodisca vitripennis]
MAGLYGIIRVVWLVCVQRPTGQSADRSTVIRSDPARWRERGDQSSLGVSTRRCTGPVKKLKFFSNPIKIRKYVKSDSSKNKFALTQNPKAFWPSRSNGSQKGDRALRAFRSQKGNRSLCDKAFLRLILCSFYFRNSSACRSGHGTWKALNSWCCKVFYKVKDKSRKKKVKDHKACGISLGKGIFLPSTSCPKVCVFQRKSADSTHELLT